MTDCKGKYVAAVHQFVRMVSVDKTAYTTFIKQVKDISLQYQQDLRDANVAEVRESIKHRDGRYLDQELTIEMDKPKVTQPEDDPAWDEETRTASQEVLDAAAKATRSIEVMYEKCKVLSGKLSTKAFTKFMERAQLPQVTVSVVQDPTDESFSTDDMKIKAHMPRPAQLSQKPKPTLILGALVHWLLCNNILKKKDRYSIEACHREFDCSLSILKRVISGKKQKGGREYKREARKRAEAETEAEPEPVERPEQPTAQVAEVGDVIIHLDNLVCQVCKEAHAPEEVLVKHYTDKHPGYVQEFACRYCSEIVTGYDKYLGHVDEHVADNCTCFFCNSVCRTLKKLSKHVRQKHPESLGLVAEEPDDPEMRVEETPQDTGEVDDTMQPQQQVTDDTLPDLAIPSGDGTGDRSGQPAKTPPSAAAGAPTTPRTPEKERERKGHKQKSEKYNIECEACNRYFKDAFVRSGHINSYHKVLLKQCAFCKSGYLYP